MARWLSARQAAACLGLSVRRTLKLGQDKILESEILGNIRVFEENSVKNHKPRPVGRPSRKQSDA
jgi:hypothetical protein